MSDKFGKKAKAKLEAPEEKEYLYFYPRSELKKQNKKLLLWGDKEKDKNFLYDLLWTGEQFHLFAFGETMSGKSNALEVLAEFMKNQHGKLIIDASGVDFEGAFWSRNYKSYIVYPQLIKPLKKNTNPNAVEVKINKKNTWKTIIQKAWTHKKVICLMCDDPLESSYLKSLIGLFKECLNRQLAHIPKIILLREISFFGYRAGQLKASTEKIVQDTKRAFSKFVRIGRHKNNQMFCDAQRVSDIDGMIGDNVAVKILKKFHGKLPNELLMKHELEAIQGLKKWHCIFRVLGRTITGTIALSSFHKDKRKNDKGELVPEKIEDLGIFPAVVEMNPFNKVVENRYIDRCGEYYTNVMNWLVFSRRRHLQDIESTALSVFEIADLLVINPNGFILSEDSLNVINPRLVYVEVKFRSAGSKHPKIESTNVKKTIQDLAIKRITWDIDRRRYFWTLNRELAHALHFNMPEDIEELRIPVNVEMTNPNGSTKQAQRLMKDHHITFRRIPITSETFFS
jgi:hypothetical protein